MPKFLSNFMHSLDRNLLRHLRPTEDEQHQYPVDQLQQGYSGLLLAIGFSVLYFLVIPLILVEILKLVVGPISEAQLGFYTILIQVIAGGVFLLVVIVALPWMKWFPSWKKPGIQWDRIVRYFFIMLMFNLLWAVLYELLGITSTSGNQELIGSLVMDSPVLMGIAIVLLAPLIEEILFRYFIFGFFSRYKVWIAVLVSSLAFGLIHVIDGFADNWMFTFQYATMGAVMAWSYIHHKRLAYPIALHGLNNLFSYVIMLILFFMQSFLP